MSIHLRDIVLVTVAALVARTLAALIVDWPPYTDPAYYHVAAERLATGHGFTVPMIWSFLEVGSRIPADPQLPVPSFGHWMPLTSIVAAGFMALLGPSWQAGQIPMVLLSTALVPLTYGVGWWLFRSRFVAIVAALLALFAGPLLLMYSTIDNFAVFGTTGAGALLCAMRSVKAERPARWLVASGLLVGLATLARIDGVLLALSTATAWWLVRPRTITRAAWLRHVGVGVLSAGAFLVVIGPWLLRNLEVYGAFLPSTGGSTLWISSYNQQFSIDSDVSLATYLAAGAGNIIGSKLFAIAELASRTASLMGGIFAIFFMVGSWSMRGRPELRPFLAYFWLMFATMALVFTFHAPKGAFYHSAPAWLPIAFAVSVGAIPSVGTSLGRFWRFLARPQTHRFLGVAGLAGAVVLSMAGSAILYQEWADSRERDARAADFLASNGDPDDVVMSTDSTSIHHFSGNPAVPVPFDPFPMIAEVVDAYDVRWVIVMRSGPDATDPLGMWEGSGSTDRDGNAPGFLPDAPAYDSDDLRIFEVVP